MAQHTDKKLNKLVTELQAIARGLTEYTETVGSLADQAPNFTTLVNELAQLNAEQERLKAQQEVATAALYAKIAEAREQRTRMYSLLRGTLGRNNQLLEAFGIQVKS